MSLGDIVRRVARLRSLWLCLLLSHAALAQTENGSGEKAAPAQTFSPPVYVEGFFGNDRFDLQTFISKSFTPTSKGGLLSITSAQGKYGDDSSSFDLVNVTQLNYDVYKGISPTLGIALNPQAGYNVTLGAQYLYVRRDLIFVLSPSVFVTGTHDVQNVLAVLYLPKLTKRLSFYSNVQVFDDYVVHQQLNARSFVHVRLGLSRARLTFGIGTDLDWYGQPSDFRTNAGAFVGYNF